MPNILVMTLVIGIFLGATIAGLIFGALKLRNVGKSWIITLPEVPGSLATIERRSVRRGFFDRKAPDDEKERHLPTGISAYPTNKGPLHIMSISGANLVAPSKYEAADAIEAQVIKEWAESYKRLPNAGDKDAFVKAYNEAKAKAEKVATRMLTNDPTTYWRAKRENLMENLYSAQAPKDPWQVRILPILAMAVIALVGILGFIIWKVMPALQGAGSA